MIKQHLNFTVSLDFSMAHATYVLELGFLLLATKHMSLYMLLVEAASSTSASLLCNLNLDFPREEQFQIGNKTLAKRKLKD